jgi:hypothetical protein
VDFARGGRRTGFGVDTFTPEQPSGLFYRPEDLPENPKREIRLAPRWFALGW